MQGQLSPAPDKPPHELCAAVCQKRKERPRDPNQLGKFDTLSNGGSTFNRAQAARGFR